MQLAPLSTSAKDMGSGDGVPRGFQVDELQLRTFCPGESEIRLPLGRMRVSHWRCGC